MTIELCDQQMGFFTAQRALKQLHARDVGSMLVGCQPIQQTSFNRQRLYQTAGLCTDQMMLRLRLLLTIVAFSMAAFAICQHTHGTQMTKTCPL